MTNVEVSLKFCPFILVKEVVEIMVNNFAIKCVDRERSRYMDDFKSSYPIQGTEREREEILLWNDAEQFQMVI